MQSLASFAEHTFVSEGGCMVNGEPEQFRRDGLAALGVLFEHSPDGVLFTQPHEGRILAANPAACAILGLSEEEICRRGRQGLLDHDDARWLVGIETLLRTGQAGGLGRVRRGDGSAIETEMTVKTFQARDGSTLACAIFRDVSEQAHTERQLGQANAQLEELLVVDELTGLSNRRGLILGTTQLLQLADQRAAEVQVLVVDIRGMTGLNQRRGHEAGDAALLAVARALRVAFRRSDVVARLGGTRLAAVALDMHQGDRAGVANRMAEHLTHTETVRFVGERVDVALGWATRRPGDTASLEDLLDQSDRAIRSAHVRPPVAAFANA
jgi:diguanylate cyclase (GGDEF)-like protein/PAS domain S-box-containing protein